MVQEIFLHLLQGSARATYLLDFNFVDIATCFSSLAAAEDDRHSNCENSTKSDVLNSTEHPEEPSLSDEFGSIAQCATWCRDIFYRGLFVYQMVVTREKRRDNVLVEG
ncbi:unnamed protein product [Porites lobata]|uniref:Uncharacterized protein n=1 Tax=Porites lobata TaxID=104759 RepID=A0ABN8R8W1_9CNID|nr:unnamed protein product [Porites lobata]